MGQAWLRPIHKGLDVIGLWLCVQRDEEDYQEFGPFYSCAVAGEVILHAAEEYGMTEDAVVWLVTKIRGILPLEITEDDLNFMKVCRGMEMAHDLGIQFAGRGMMELCA